MKYIFGNNNLISDLVQKKKRVYFNRGKGQECCVREDRLLIRVFEYLALS
jgi:hypothetical protein